MVSLLKESFQTVLAYAGNGLLLLYFLASVVYLLIRERDRGVRKMMATYPIWIIVLFFLPVFPYVIIHKAGEAETFYRYLWLIPMSAVSAYATILFLDHVKFKWLRYVLGVAAMVCVCIGGNPGYRSPVMVPAENAYQLPEDLIELCDYMVIPGREVEAVFPHELVPYVRQYTPYIVMPYGYETMVDRWNFTNPLAEEMIKDVSSAELLAAYARERGCHYIVLNKDHYVDGELADYDYEPVYRTKQYLVYRNLQGDFFTP